MQASVWRIWTVVFTETIRVLRELSKISKPVVMKICWVILRLCAGRLTDKIKLTGTEAFAHQGFFLDCLILGDGTDRLSQKSVTSYLPILHNIIIIQYSDDRFKASSQTIPPHNAI
jgi:hypothetical protein